MPARNRTSTYFFVGRLSDHTAKYQIQQEPLLDGFHLEIYLDGIALWVNTDKPFKRLYPEVKEIFNLIVSAFVFKTEKPLGYTLNNWVESKKVISSENIIGWVFPHFTPLKPLRKNARESLPWRKAAWLYRNLSNGNNNHRLALKDYRAALSDTTQDAFLFAFRALEDVCRAVTDAEEIYEPEWNQMHNTLKTTSTERYKIMDLTKISAKVRHGNVNHKIVPRSKKKKDEYLEVVHKTLARELKRTFPQF